MKDICLKISILCVYYWKKTMYLFEYIFFDYFLYGISFIKIFFNAFVMKLSKNSILYSTQYNIVKTFIQFLY